MRFNPATLLVLAVALIDESAARTENTSAQVVIRPSSLHHDAQNASNASAKEPAAASVATEPRARRLEAALKSADEQVKAKAKDVEVQRGLIKEEEDTAIHAQGRAAALATRAGQLREEAAAAAAVARQRSEAATHAETDLKDAEAKVLALRDEDNEARKFLNQTLLEEHALELRVASLQAEQAHLGPLGSRVEVTVHNATVPATVAVTVPHNDSTLAAGAAASNASNAASMREAMRKLADENDRLKHEKDALIKQLATDRAVQEKEKLRRKLKNRLVQKDRRILKAKTL